MRLRVPDKGGFPATKASDGRTALEELKKNCFDLVITDLNLPEANGLAVLKEAKKTNPDTTVIIESSGNQDIKFLIEALRLALTAFC
jgi:YesN/AraC family two-component response regulator